MPQFVFLTTFLCTVFALQWWQLPQYPIWIWLLLFEGIALGRKRVWILWSCIGILIALISVTRTTHLPSLNTIDTYAIGDRVTIDGVISREPDRRPLQTKYTIQTDSITDAHGTIHKGVEGNVLITDNRQWPEYEYGDAVSVTGILEKPDAIEDFQYDSYLSRFDIYSVIYRGTVSKSESVSGIFSVSRILFAAKQRFEKQINTLFPEPHASFMAGLLTGSRKGIPEHLMEAMHATGLTHIIAISGYNITIVIAVMMSAFFWMPIRCRYISTILCIVCFVIFVGSSAAVVRAGIMGILGIIALHIGRASSVRLSILWTAFFMTAWNPKILWYDAGFQLSFLAVIGLVELSPLLEKWFAGIPNTLAIRESLMMTIAAQIAAVPLIITLFERVSLVAPFANVLVAPALPLAMFFGAVATIVSFISVPIGLAIAYFGWMSLQWVIWTAKALAAIPFASMNLTIATWLLLPYYFIVIITIYKDRCISFLESKALPFFLLDPFHARRRHKKQSSFQE